MFMSKLSVNRSVISAARQKIKIFIHRYFSPSVKYVYHLVPRYPHRTGIVFSSTWLHAKNFIMVATIALFFSFSRWVCVCVCVWQFVLVFINSIFLIFFPLFTAFLKVSCVITTSLTLLLTYETLVKQNQFVLKYTHIDFFFWLLLLLFTLCAFKTN